MQSSSGEIRSPTFGGHPEGSQEAPPTQQKSVNWIQGGAGRLLRSRGVQQSNDGTEPVGTEAGAKQPAVSPNASGQATTARAAFGGFGRAKGKAAHILGNFAARGGKSAHSPAAGKQQAQHGPTDEGASPQREAGPVKAGKSYQNKKPYLSGPPQKARPVMAPPQNIKIQQKDSSNQPAPINDNDMV